MPAKGKHKLTDEERIAILVDKRLRMSTVKDVAQAHGLAENTLYRIEREASPAVQAQVEEILKRLADRIAEVRDTALVQMKQTLQGDNIPLNHLAKTFAVLYDKHALETNRRTNRVEHTVLPETHCLDFLRVLLTKLDKPDALEALSKSDLRPLVSNSTRDRVVRLLRTGEIAFPEN